MVFIELDLERSKQEELITQSDFYCAFYLGSRIQIKSYFLMKFKLNLIENIYVNKVELNFELKLKL